MSRSPSRCSPRSPTRREVRADVEEQSTSCASQAQKSPTAQRAERAPRRWPRAAQPAADVQPARRRDDEARRAHPTALGGQGKQASPQIAGDMEIFLASDVIYSQRVVPFIQQTLALDGTRARAPPPSRSLPNLGGSNRRRCSRASPGSRRRAEHQVGHVLGFVVLSTRVLWRSLDSMMTSPPLPPSPPEGPPRGTYFSRRKAMQPLPPSPALTRIFASSMNTVDPVGGGQPSHKPRRDCRPRLSWPSKARTENLFAES